MCMAFFVLGPTQVRDKTGLRWDETLAMCLLICMLSLRGAYDVGN